MENFIAYHSARVMGYEYEPDGSLSFFSRKVGLLERAVGNKVWVINGSLDGRKTIYTLRAAYITDGVSPIEDEPGLYEVYGKNGIDFTPFVQLNDLPWFQLLLKSQSNFSIGFNRFTNESVLKALKEIEVDFIDNQTDQAEQVDFDLSVIEGNPRLVFHLRRERNQAIVEAKRKSVLAQQGKLICEVCGFDFFETYGSVGQYFCEIHHLEPLSNTSEARQTKLDDLAVVCANCHRIIHRSNPMMSIGELSEIVQLIKSPAK